MIFDFHTHIFPDKIAKKTVSILKQNIVDVKGCSEPPVYTDATVLGLKQSMKKNEIDYSLVLPIATTVLQSNTINNFAAAINGKDNIFSFGSVHPLQNGVEAELERIKELGLLGIKLHPEYQNVYINSPECVAVLKKCAELKLVVISHTGEDVGMRPPVRSNPQMIYDAMQYVPDLTFVAAHMGSWNLWKDVEKYLVGTSIYFDTSYSFQFLGKDRFFEIASKHKNIVFGTDSPWDCQGTAKTDIASCGFDSELYKRIMYQNALDILKIKLF